MNKFNVGDIVVCVNSWDVESFLTVGKEYKVVDFNGGIIKIIDDSDTIGGFDIRRFVLAKDYVPVPSQDNTKQALSLAVAAFDSADTHEYLLKIIHLLGGEEAHELVLKDSSAAYRKYCEAKIV